MSAAAVLLAVALLIAPGPFAMRRRISVGPISVAPVHHRRRSDPLATASALDVFAVCLSAGMSVSAAAAATAPSAPDRLAALLRRAADLLALGADPDTAWSRPAGADEGDDGLARLARRSASSGSALAQGVAELAEQSRQDAGHHASAAAERASVLIAGPLGLCFLPAFVCLGIVPVVAGLASDVFTSGIL
ncbi:pilus assembly protein TadC [Mycolicibacterium sp. BK556]|uniref:type II secretion system F family protein n=1 Tax=Mycobacteriaceae TaxID=1762 RepID=UPI0010D63B1C|nr:MULTISPECIES: type II secretion system F family protein [Mycobacteriaceae]MBB3601536.1 pilus assembly protein TadC [Mycolicibacterium sp. BK556]MBB3631288.1 pilus assembly protein TadC [Mycolicibacterium sp. BK607]MBB3749292.1 pilus assembly protein TadC [Mycolicibacterium sp. BK634]TDO14489.1 type II secretion system (T2SS) protein F [Mycobacterium sp. BK086]